MRSSKSRSRSKSNRQRSLGNIVNRVFDSSGPEGKVRGTPQQIIDKYLMLARDAQLSNDRVAEQNFLQHAEHYTRMLGEAQRELSREQEMRQSQPGEGGHHGGHGQNGGHAQNAGHAQNGNHVQPNGERPHHRPRPDDRAERDGGEHRSAIAARDEEGDEGPGLVETPEARMERRGSAVMMPAMPEPDAAGIAPGTAPGTAAAPAAEGAALPRKSRGPRKPREKRDATDTPDSPADAAE